MSELIRKIKKLLIYIREIVYLVLCWPIAHVVGKRREIYLISERGHEARDNGSYMFRYFGKYHPEKEVYYVIDCDSEDLKNVEGYGKLVWYGSFRHHVLFYAAKYCISTHIFGYTPNIDFYAGLIRKGKFSDKKYVSLKHGILKSNIQNLYAEKTKLDLLISGARPEYEYIRENFHYPEGVVQYTGLARFDGLHDFKVKRQILVMPTWRNYLYLLSRKEFGESQYYKAWSAFLKDPRTKALLEAHDLQLVFYPHYELQKYVDMFKTDSDRIIIADKEHYDVQTLLKESCFLITDYSSIYFDFAYMQKPCMYYQFDRAQFYGEHYKMGYFDEARDGFGETVYDHEELMTYFTGYVQNGFAVKDLYAERINGFFELHDCNNCARIYNEIAKLTKK